MLQWQCKMTETQPTSSRNEQYHWGIPDMFLLPCFRLLGVKPETYLEGRRLYNKNQAIQNGEITDPKKKAAIRDQTQQWLETFSEESWGRLGPIIAINSAFPDMHDSEI